MFIFNSYGLFRSIIFIKNSFVNENKYGINLPDKSQYIFMYP